MGKIRIFKKFHVGVACVTDIEHAQLQGTIETNVQNDAAGVYAVASYSMFLQKF